MILVKLSSQRTQFKTKHPSDYVMKKIITILSIITATAFIAPAPVYSAEKKKPAAPETKPEEKKTDAKKDHYPLNGVVVSITDSLLVTKGGEGKEDHKFDITKETKIHAGDKAATVKDVKVGQRVTGYVHKMEKGNPELVSLNVAPVDKKKEEPKTETPKKKK